MEYKFKPEGVCSTEMIVDIEDGIIKKIQNRGKVWRICAEI